MLTYKIHLIRHGLTQGNIEGRYIGSTDMPICEQGERQLEQMRDQCEYPNVGRVYVSPLTRARQSAAILFPEHEQSVTDGLRELDFGDFEGKTGEELDKLPEFREWIGSAMASAPPNGESGAALVERVSVALADIFAEMMRDRVSSAAVVTHGGVIMTLLAAMGLPEREMLLWQTRNGEGYTILLTTQMWMRDHKFEVYEQIPRPR